MATNAWGVTAAAATSSWADHVDEEEEAIASQPVAAAAPSKDFPSLGEAIKQAPKAKKKGQKLNLGEFLVGVKPPLSSKVTDRDILASLPTAPRGAVDGEDDDRAGMGGGFKDYGGRGGFGGE